MAEKMKTGNDSRMKNVSRFGGNTNLYVDGNTALHRIYSRHHKSVFHKEGYRNKYASYRWINDVRGCGWGCIVAKRRFTY